METLYKIRLLHGKWYVGKTRKFNRRMDQHLGTEEGAAWCKKYGGGDDDVSCIKEALYDDATHAETKLTLQLMIDNGINNVRGAEYCQLELYTKGDARRMAFAACHHLKRDVKEIQGIFESQISKENRCSQQSPGGKRQKIESPTSSSSSSSSSSLSSPVTPQGAAHALTVAETRFSADSEQRLSAGLKILRSDIAGAMYEGDKRRVYTDKAIDEICKKKPRTRDDLMQVYGIGTQQCDDFGEEILQFVQLYCPVQLNQSTLLPFSSCLSPLSPPVEVAASPQSAAPAMAAVPLIGSDSGQRLSKDLKALRTEIAIAKYGGDARFVFANRTIDEICEQKPRTRDDLMLVYGIGEKKYEIFGERILGLVKKQFP